MSLTELGELSLAVAIPASASVAVAALAGIQGALPSLQAQLTALANFAPSLGSFAADITLATNLIASLTTAISLGLTPPSLDAQLAIVAGILAGLQAALVAIEANLQIVVDFQSILTTGGFYGYVYDGAANAFGTAVSSEFSGGLPGGQGGDNIKAIMFVTGLPATWNVFSTFFLVAV